MEKYYPQFVTNLQLFLANLQNIHPSRDVADFLKVFEKLDMIKIIIKFLNTMRKFETDLLKRNKTIFEENIKPLPGIDLKTYWKHVSDEQQTDFWTQLQVLYVLAEQLVSSSKGSQKEERTQLMKDMTEDIKVHSEGKVLFFNPFLGVGGDENVSMEDLFNPDVKLPGEGQSLLDFGKIKEQIKNMSPEDLEKATRTIKDLMGDDIDENTSNTITTMLQDISSELQNTNLEGDPMKNLMKVAESVAHKMKKKINNNEIDGEKLMNSIGDVSGKCLGDICQKMGVNKDMLTTMMETMTEEEMRKMATRIAKGQQR